MIWFNGTINHAVEEAKASKSMLLVFIRGEDDLSMRYEKLLNDETVLKPGHYIAVKISYNSVVFEQFKKIYVTVPVPSVFIIGTNGIPLTVVCSQEPLDVINEISKTVLDKQNVKSDKIEKENGKIKKMPPPDAEVGGNTDMTSMKLSERKNNIDFERLKFIVEDKKINFEPTRNDPSFFLNEIHYSCDQNCSYQNTQSARIQFRLPSNEVRSWEFPNLCTLNDVRLYLMESMKLNSGFKLLRVYPRSAFTDEDENKTLTDLSLTPNATLIVVPLEDNAIKSKFRKFIVKKNIVISFVTAILEPVFLLFRYFKNFLQKPAKEEREKPKTSRRSAQKRFMKKTRNIHGFAFDSSDTDSDMNTDNGNSTQQK